MLNQRGVTLIEAATCLVIVSLLGAVSTPAIFSWRGRMKLRAEATHLMGCLQQAKMEAIKANSYVVLGVEDDHYFVFVDDGKGAGVAMDWVRQPGERQIVTNHIGKGITMTSNFTNDKVRFSGRAGITAGSFFLSDSKGNQMQVVLSFIGRIRITRS